MASLVSTGSPKLGRKTSPGFNVLDQNDDCALPKTDELAVRSAPTFGQSLSSSQAPSPLQSTKLANLQAKVEDKARVSSSDQSKKVESSKMDEILARLRFNEARKAAPMSSAPDDPKNGPKTINKLLTNLNGQTQALHKQRMDLMDESESDGPKEEEHSSGSDLYTPATESFDIISSADHNNGDTSQLEEAAEILRVKQELAAAKSKISRQEQELAESRKLKHTMEQAMGPASEADFSHRAEISEQTIGNLQSAFNASARPFTSRTDSWHPHDDTRSVESDALSAGSYYRGRGIWNNPVQPQLAGGLNNTAQPPLFNDSRGGPGPEWNNGYGNQIYGNPTTLGGNQRMATGPAASTYGFDSRYSNEQVPIPGQNIGVRRTMSQFNRQGPNYGNRSGTYGNYPNSLTSMNPAPLGSMGIPIPMGYQPRPIGSPMSPTLSDFTTGSVPTIGSPWSSMSAASSQTYITPLEPVNYRRLLDKAVSCDWKYIVDKIVCSNDQQASIFLQQKLKVGTAEQKFEIVEAIVNQAYPLMINRFGNFLVQRCFEHGTPDQVVAIANAIHGNVLSLSMDAFGCHVIQKAFDSVPEQHKADMVRELLRRIPDTVIHRYACHVWQKLFELRWSGEPPQIMLKVNEALRGMWHEVALGETGSLVVQNIFENCVEEEKRPAIEEVIANIDLIAHGQFGNWCIQHLCEHGSPPDKRRVIDHILCNAYSYSIDQFASKVVEKCLKIGGVEFLERYLGVITTAHPDRPRIPLIDISGDQYGNYLIQWILMNTHHHQREQVAVHIRKHMVSLRGSKFGSRVAMLCCNPASVTRPGPGVVINPFGAPGQPRGWGRLR